MATGRRDAQVHGRTWQRVESGTARRDAPGDELARRRGGRRREADRIGRGQRQPPHRLPPERVIGAIGRRQQHSPAPRRLPREHNRAAVAITLHRDQRAGRAARPAGQRQHVGAGPGPAERRHGGERGNRLPAFARLVEIARQLHDRVRFPRCRQLDPVRAARRSCRRLQHAASRSERSSGSTSSSGVSISPLRTKDCAPRTSRPPPRFPTKSRVASS